MNRTLVLAAILAAATAAIHVIAGGADVAEPLLASGLRADAKLTLYAAWHMVSLLLAASAVALLAGSQPRHADACRCLVRFISALWCASGVVFLIVAAVQLDYHWFFRLPQWMLLLPVGLLGLRGSSPARRPAT